MISTKRTLAIDFDGTIADSKYPDTGTPKPGVKEALTKLQEKYLIVVYSCRTNRNLTNDPHHAKAIIEKFMKKHKIPYDYVDDGSEGKIVAEYYIDDRAVRFNDNWPEIALALRGKK